MAASLCMQTFYPSPHLNPCFLSFWFHLHFLHRIFLGICDKGFPTLNCCQHFRDKYSIQRSGITISSQDVQMKSGFWPLVITHFNKSSRPFVSGADESVGDLVAGESASTPVLLLRESPSARSSAVFYYVRLTACVRACVRAEWEAPSVMHSALPKKRVLFN